MLQSDIPERLSKRKRVLGNILSRVVPAEGSKPTLAPSAEQLQVKSCQTAAKVEIPVVCNLWVGPRGQRSWGTGQHGNSLGNLIIPTSQGPWVHATPTWRYSP